MSSEGYQSFYQNCRLSIYVSTTNDLSSNKRLVVLRKKLLLPNFTSTMALMNSILIEDKYLPTLSSEEP